MNSTYLCDFDTDELEFMHDLVSRPLFLVILRFTFLSVLQFLFDNYLDVSEIIKINFSYL